MSELASFSSIGKKEIVVDICLRESANVSRVYKNEK